jgi:hypothetical protein
MKRLLTAAGLTVAFSVPIAIFATMGIAQSNTSARAQYSPRSTSAPNISGTVQEGSTLTTSTGGWASSSNVTYSYQWQRCSSSGSSCANISGATAQSYKVTSADVGNRLRVLVTARNSDGSSTAESSVTGAVAAAKGSQGSQTGSTVAVSSVSLPDRLVIDDVKFSPNPVRTRTSITARFHVKEVQNGKSVSDALVYAIGLPYSRVTVPAEVKTDATGWATVTFNPSKFFPRKGYVTVFIRARKAGDDALAGVSTRRLVQFSINR